MPLSSPANAPVISCQHRCHLLPTPLWSFADPTVISCHCCCHLLPLSPSPDALPIPCCRSHCSWTLSIVIVVIDFCLPSHPIQTTLRTNQWPSSQCSITTSRPLCRKRNHHLAVMLLFAILTSCCVMNRTMLMFVIVWNVSNLSWIVCQYCMNPLCIIVCWNWQSKDSSILAVLVWLVPTTFVQTIHKQVIVEKV